MFNFKSKILYSQITVPGTCEMLKKRGVTYKNILKYS